MPNTTPVEARLLQAMATITDEMANLKTEVHDMRKEVAATKELVEAWTTVKTMGRFIKWFSGLLTGAAAIWLLMKVGAQHLVGAKH